MRSLGPKKRARHLCWSCSVLQTTPSQMELSIGPHIETKIRNGVQSCRAPRESRGSRFVLVSTQSFDESCDIPNWTTNCVKTAITTDRVNTRLGACSWRAVKRATWSNAFPLCSFVSETFADSSYTSQDREDTNGLKTHENSSGVITTRGLDMDSQIANVVTQKQKVARIVDGDALRNWRHVHLKTMLVTDCCALVWIGLVTFRRVLIYLCGWMATPPVIGKVRTHHVACNMARTSAPSTNNFKIDMLCCGVDGPRGPSLVMSRSAGHGTRDDVEKKCQCASPSSVRTTLKHSMKLRIIKCC